MIEFINNETNEKVLEVKDFELDKLQVTYNANKDFELDLSKWGIEVRNEDGSFRNFIDVISEIAKKVPKDELEQVSNQIISQRQ